MAKTTKKKWNGGSVEVAQGPVIGTRGGASSKSGEVSFAAAASPQSVRIRNSEYDPRVGQTAPPVLDPRTH